jgi:hypothetical protein
MSANIYLEKSVLAQSLLKDVIVDLSKEPVAIATLFIITTSNSTKKNQKPVVACTRYHHSAQICFWKQMNHSFLSSPASFIAR